MCASVRIYVYVRIPFRDQNTRVTLTLRCRRARQSLRNIILALTSSIVPVLNAYFVLLVAMCICEISLPPGAP